MAHPEFHDSEIEKFIEECTNEKIVSNDLLLRFREDITQDNLLHGSNGIRRKLRDYLDSNEVQCGKGTGDPIQGRLLALLSDNQRYRREPQSSGPAQSTAPISFSQNTGKRDFLKVNRSSQDQYSGPYEGPIISAVKRRFLQDCEAFEVPVHQRLSVLHAMLRDDALRFFTDHVMDNVTTAEEAFDKLHAQFMTPAHRDTYTTEWNTLSFSDMRTKHPGKGQSQLLDLLFQRARDLQSLLEAPYNSPLLLRDCVIRANEDFDYFQTEKVKLEREN